LSFYLTHYHSYYTSYSHISFFFSFFFYCYSPHPDLHSFPTRRSSDLTRSRRALPTSPWRGRRRNARTCRSGGAAAPSPHVRALRSEEHTSELQSHLNLVCRLLLEKKKKIRITDKYLTRGKTRYYSNTK